MRRLRLGPETMFARISLLRYDDLQPHLRAAEVRPYGQREHARAQDSSWWSPDLMARRFGAYSLAGLAVGLACDEFRSRSDSCALRRSNCGDSPRIEGPFYRVRGSPVSMAWRSTEFSDPAILADHNEFVKRLCWKYAVFAVSRRLFRGSKARSHQSFEPIKCDNPRPKGEGCSDQTLVKANRFRWRYAGTGVAAACAASSYAALAASRRARNSPTCRRPMTIRWIWLVPSKIW